MQTIVDPHTPIFEGNVAGGFRKAGFRAILPVMHNRVGPSDMVGAIPREHFRYIVELIENFRIDPERMRQLIMLSHKPVEPAA